MVIRQPRTSIHILDDDSLLNLFSLFRPSLFEENQDDSVPRGNWLRERWWYKLVHVCQRWRYLILGSVSHLGLCLVCTRGTPVADMLTRSPPLPLIIGFEDENHGLTAEDEEGIMLALQHRNRVRRIYFRMPVPSLHTVHEYHRESQLHFGQIVILSRGSYRVPLPSCRDQAAQLLLRSYL
jgi:hypothetical protein